MTSYVIENNIPIPTHKIGMKSEFRLAVEQLEPGQSIFMPDIDGPKLSSKVGFMRKALHWQFACRTVDGGARVWRLS